MTQMRSARPQRGARRNWASLALVVVACSIGCSHWGIGSVACPPLPDPAREELESCCGPELEMCRGPGGIESWLSDLEAACRAAAIR